MDNNSEKFTAHFALHEFVESGMAEKHGIPNEPSKCHIMRLRNLAVRCLEPTRQHFGLPLQVTSGYRCARLNELVHGVKNSQHMTGEAAEFKRTSHSRGYIVVQRDAGEIKTHLTKLAEDGRVF